MAPKNQDITETEAYDMEGNTRKGEIPNAQVMADAGKVHLGRSTAVFQLYDNCDTS